MDDITRCRGNEGEHPVNYESAAALQLTSFKPSTSRADKFLGTSQLWRMQWASITSSRIIMDGCYAPVVKSTGRLPVFSTAGIPS